MSAISQQKTIKLQETDFPLQFVILYSAFIDDPCMRNSTLFTYSLLDHSDNMHTQ